MKRSGPPARKTELARGKPLARSTILPAAPRVGPARTPIKRSPRPAAPRTQARTGPASKVVDAVRERDQGRCVRCGGPASNTHHREGRGMGGRKGADSARVNGPAYLLSMCGSGTTGCHGWVTEHPAAAEVEGYVLRRNATARPPACDVPVLTADGWALFDDDGTRQPTSPPEETP